MRLDKFLGSCGLGSRRQMKELLKKKQILVNGQIVTSPKVQVDDYQDEIVYQGQVLTYEKYLYYLLNKPKGVISATDDNHHQTVLELLDKTARDKEVFPVGRLDIDTHGLLLLTNNGKLAHAMLSPKKHVDKTYRANVEGVMTSGDIKDFEAGIVLEDVICQPAQLLILEKDELRQTSLVEITLKEGKFHQVKRMVKACGKTVVDLQRVSMGPLTLESSLKLGEWRYLTAQELKSLTIYGVDL